MIVIACSDPKLVNRWNRALGKKYPSYTVSQKTALVRAISSLKPPPADLAYRLAAPPRGKRTAAIQRLSPLTKILVISDSPTTSEGISVLKAGAKGYCSSHINAALFKKAAKTMLQNELWAGHKIVTKLVEEMIAHSRHEMLTARSKTPLDTLSARKRQIAELVIEGATNKEIAGRLNISEATVKSHLTVIFHRLQLAGRLKLALLSKAQTMAD